MFFTRLCLILSRSYFDANDVFGVIEAKGIVTTAIWTIRSSYDSIFPVFMYALYGHPRYSSSAQNINSVTRISILSCLFLWLWLNFYHSSFVKLFCKAHLNRCFWKGKRNLIFLCTHNAKKWSFLLSIFSVNVTKSSWNCESVTFPEEISNGKLHFLYSDMGSDSDIPQK